jgi:hypothetical protein
MIYPERREPDDADQHGTGSNATLDLKASRVGIGAALRTLYSDVLREEVSGRMAELLKQLEQQEADAPGVSADDRKAMG